MSIPVSAAESDEQFLSGGGEMGKLIRTMDWSKTALGPIESWPQSLRTSVSLCLSSTFPILIAWGPETIQIYNDSYRPICGAMHPQSMGMNFRICWESALEVVGDKFTRGQQGEGTYIQDQRMFLQRYGYLEEAFMTFSFAPIRDESGGVGGIFHPITETTEKMLSGRRTQVLRDLGAAIGKAKSVQEIGALTLSQYEAYQLDIPFMLFYELRGEEVELISSAGIQSGEALAPFQASTANSNWPFQELISQDEMLQVNDLGQIFGDFDCAPYEEAPHTAMLLPVRISGQAGLFGFIIAGVSARRALDSAYLNFYDQLAATYNTAISNVYAYEQEQKRAEALAAIDRSKTAFFSNVSHEFRTPLTLMLGPLEELLQQRELDTQARLNAEATHRNALRLLKLVNNLLDYSRVEAGRVQAVYQPVDLPEMTIDLASSFRSIIEKAGMKLHVHCPELNDTIYADRQMWEKIVLNLLSNAFKYTLEGSITVSLESDGHQAVLRVTDTGVGIPDHELPHMFERFHRVENTAGRTHEGTGIGLSLVHELVHLHGGTISVASIEGQGSTFTVCIPAGKAHLPEKQIIEDKRDIDSSAIKGAFIKEAYSLLQDEEMNSSDAVSRTATDLNNQQDHSTDKATHILIVDDNHDMRNYLKRLLEPYFTVHTATNGRAALGHIAAQVPDLVLSDIMMPIMDGKVMLEHIRMDEKTLRLPVIFLSARAGEEARIDGLEAGADDYLVKPFSAAELLTKVRAQIHISKTRGQAEQQLEKMNNTLQLAIEAANMGIWQTNLATGDLLINERARYIHGIAQDMELSYLDALERLIVPEHLDRMRRAIDTAVQYKGRFNEDYQILPLTGGPRKWLNTRGMVELDELGEASSVIGTILDISESKEDEMRKNDFIGMVSHELKTPLTSLIGYNQLGLRTAGRNDDTINAPIYQKAGVQLRKMSGLINGFLNVSQLESGKIILRKSSFRLDELIREMIADIGITAVEQKFESDLQVVDINADRDKIGTVMTNLLSNAIKYGAKNKPIFISCAQNDNIVRVSVRDEGIGIKSSDLDKLFDRYYRVESSQTQHISGFGIGLYLSAEIIRRHHGKIWAESEPGAGTSFFFELPA
ncbi:ATP-binding protein [Pedobacter sp. GR22-6]|uniref:ATP-binding protein n=1 Tax=Pedobacter sp. GR22-6 TaxID=3127957 RepID=UPI00307D2597